MPRYELQDSETGRSVVVEGDSAPSEQEVADIFASLPAISSVDGVNTPENNALLQQLGQQPPSDNNDKINALNARRDEMRLRIGDNPELVKALDEAYIEQARSIGVEPVGIGQAATLPRVTGQDVQRATGLGETASSVVAGVQRGSASLVEGLAAPEGIGLFTGGVTGKIIGQSIAGQMTAAYPEAVKHFSAALGGGDIEGAIEATVPLALTPLVAKTAVKELGKSAVSTATSPEIKAIAQAKAPLTAEAVKQAVEPAKTESVEPLGINRPSVIDQSLTSLTDEAFSVTRKEVNTKLDALEQQYDDLGGNLTAAQRTELARAQDAYTAVENEFLRRGVTDQDPADLFNQLRLETDKVKQAIMLNELRRQGVTEAEMLKDVELRSPDEAEVFKGQLEELRKLEQELNPPAQLEAPKTEATPPAESKPTSIANADVNLERAKRGELPLMDERVQTNETSEAAASRLIAADESIGTRLVNDIREGRKESTTAVEQEILRLESDRVRKNRSSAGDRAGDESLTPEERQQASREWDEFNDRLNEVDQATKMAGTAVARALQIRGRFAERDYSPAELERTLKAKKSAKLTPEEVKYAESKSKQILEAEKKADVIEQEIIEGKRPAPTKRQIAEDVVKKWESSADEAVARLKKRLGQVGSGPDPSIIGDLALIARAKLGRGALKFADWSAEMKRDFGKEVEPYLQDAWTKAKRQLSRVKSLGTRLNRQEAELKSKIERAEQGDASVLDKPVKEELDLTDYPDLIEARARVEQLKNEFNEKADLLRFKNAPVFEKSKTVVGEAYNLARSLITTGELSFILRQGKFGVLSHPGLAAKALPATFRSFKSEINRLKAEAELKAEPNYQAAVKAKLHFHGAGDKLSKMDETFASRLTDKIPIVKSFNRATETFLNRLRYDVWNTMRTTLAKDGKPTLVEDKQLAKYVNQATGRGTLGTFERSAEGLSKLMFSPRYLASRLQYHTGHSLFDGTLRSRKVIAREYARTLIGLGLYYTLLYNAFRDEDGAPTIETDARSSDFGKIKLGNTRIDPLAGLAQVIVFEARSGYNLVDEEGYKSLSGRISKLRDAPIGSPSYVDVLASFARSKAHPVLGAYINYQEGKDPAGQPVSLPGEAAKFTYPITYGDIYSVMLEEGLEKGTALSLLAFLGEGIQTYEKREKK